MPNLNDQSKLKPIAYHLPQFHPIKENDEWWGKGFTEWTNVTKSKPKFSGHYQPHLPTDMGFYDLRLLDTMIAQAELAKKYGLYGFCFYHYWFNGKLLLETPLEQMLKAGKPNFPFCLCWANENWTRRWDGAEQEILIKQDYSLEDDRAHIKYLIPFFKDDRYIKIDGKPVFLMYRTELHPNIKEATEIWREEVKIAGFPDLYLIRVENFKKNIDPSLHGFNAGTEFAPDGSCSGKKATKKNLFSYVVSKLLHKTKLKSSAKFKNMIFSYPNLASNMINKPKPNYKYFRCITPSWDNSARRNENAIIYIDNDPKIFGNWAKKMVEYTKTNLPENEQLLFVNAWNEWGEGAHLEPDQKYGFKYLEELANAIK